MMNLGESFSKRLYWEISSEKPMCGCLHEMRDGCEKLGQRFTPVRQRKLRQRQSRKRNV